MFKIITKNVLAGKHLPSLKEVQDRILPNLRASSRPPNNL